MESNWPPHRIEIRQWRQEVRGGTREDRMLSQIATSVPPRISEIELLVEPPLGLLSEDMVRTVTMADSEASVHSAALGQFMARNESIASSKIEQMEATADDFARAVAGSKANPNARSMVAATRALQDLVRTVGSTGRFTRDAILDAHLLLMQDDADLANRKWAGAVRQDQNWLGGSDYSPRNAIYIPPPAEYVEELLADLIHFANRDDVPVIVQCAVVHAQFESIHPFTDGNGRIGRTLISALLQRRGITRNTVIPLASGLAALRDEYFAGLDAYRNGDLTPIASLIAHTSITAADEARISFKRLQAMPQSWRAELSRRADAAAVRILEQIFDQPTLTSGDFIHLTGGSISSAFGAIDALADAGIIREVTGRKRDRIWVVTDVVDELDDLDARIRSRVTS